MAHCTALKQRIAAGIDLSEEDRTTLLTVARAGTTLLTVARAALANLATLAPGASHPSGRGE